MGRKNSPAGQLDNGNVDFALLWSLPRRVTVEKISRILHAVNMGLIGF